MSIQGTLVVDDIEFRVLDFSFDFFPPQQSSGRSDAKPLTFVIEAERNDTFFDWVIHDTMMKKRCKITFSPTHGTSKGISIELLDVYCLSCQYDYNASGSNPFTVSLVLSPATIVRNGRLVLKRNWAITDLAMLHTVPVKSIQKIHDPQLTNYHIEDKSGNSIEQENIRIGDKITLVIQSQHAQGKTIIADLYDKRMDYQYKGETLKDDKLNIQINQPEIRIPLTTIKPEP